MKLKKLLIFLCMCAVSLPGYGFSATERPVTAHTEDAVVLNPQPENAPSACAIYPGYESHEDGTVVINGQGHIMFSPGPEHQLLRSVDNGETWHIVDPSSGSYQQGRRRYLDPCFYPGFPFQHLAI